MMCIFFYPLQVNELIQIYVSIMNIANIGQVHSITNRITRVPRMLEPLIIIMILIPIFIIASAIVGYPFAPFAANS